MSATISPLSAKCGRCHGAGEILTGGIPFGLDKVLPWGLHEVRETCRQCMGAKVLPPGHPAGLKPRRRAGA